MHNIVKLATELFHCCVSVLTVDQSIDATDSVPFVSQQTSQKIIFRESLKKSYWFSNGVKISIFRFGSLIALLEETQEKRSCGFGTALKDRY